MFWSLLFAVVGAAALYSVFCMLKPMPPFKTRWSAGLAAFFLYAAFEGVNDARLEALQTEDPAAYQQMMAAREAREARRKLDKQKAEQARREKAARVAAARAEQERCGDEIEALTYAREAIKTRLRAPATADFPWANDDHVERLGCGRFRVREYVDSQNGFGANIRSHFVVTMTKRPDAWYAEDVRIW